MPIRLAIIGPGRVGRALGRRFAEAGVDLLGYVGRSDGSAAAAVAFAGRGQVLTLREVVAAHVVVFAVGDPDLPAVVAAAAQDGSRRRCSLWLHTSGRHGLEVLGPLTGPGIRLGALHPVAPFPDAETGLRQLAGRPAVLLGEPSARRLLLRLARLLGMAPLWARTNGDRTLYHAACALAANGLTALRATVDAALRRADVLRADDADALVHALMGAALQACRDRTAAGALSGPVVRGDHATVAAHRAALRGVGDGRLDDVYRVLMLAAVDLAQQRGLADAAATDLRRALGAAME